MFHNIIPLKALIFLDETFREEFNVVLSTGNSYDVAIVDELYVVNEYGIAGEDLLGTLIYCLKIEEHMKGVHND